jgi:hypothetical protein
MISRAIPESVKIEIRHLANFNVMDKRPTVMTAPCDNNFASMHFKKDAEIKQNPDVLKAAPRR